MKIERDNNHIVIMQKVEEKPYAHLKSSHELLKEEMLWQNGTN